MSIWKDLLLLGGYAATPLALRAIAPELVDPAPPSPAPPCEPPTAPAPAPVRLPWAGTTIDHLLLR
jgi:hypothetical protein